MNKGIGAGKYENLYTAMHAAMRPQGAQQARDVTIRAVEQGSRLLAAPPHHCRVVLQMPRGNLEGICPRVLVLAGIAAHLQVIAQGLPCGIAAHILQRILSSCANSISSMFLVQCNSPLMRADLAFL